MCGLGWVPVYSTGWSGLVESQPVFSTRCQPLLLPVEVLLVKARSGYALGIENRNRNTVF